MSTERPATIMLIDDDIGHARLTEKNLQRVNHRYSVHHFNDGRTALDYLLGGQWHASGPPHKPSLILLDLNIPGCDGFEILTKLKANYHTCIIPVIVFSTTDSMTELTRCYELGCSFFITKPVDYNHFSETIQKLGHLLHIFKLPEAQ